METEPSLTLVQLKKLVKDTAWLINHFIDQNISSSNRNSSFPFVVFTASNKVSGEKIIMECYSSCYKAAILHIIYYTGHENAEKRDT